MAISAIPTPPSRGTPDSVFSPAVDACLGALPLMITQINAATAAMNLNSTNGNSATSMAIGTGAKSFAVDTGKSYVPGQTVKVAYTTDATKWMLGDVTAYNIGTGAITVFVAYTQSTGTYAAWTVSLSPPAPVVIPSGSKTVWYQAAAPTGWTQDSSMTGGYAMRVVSGAGGGNGGSVAFTTAFASQAVAGSNSATTLVSSQIPDHQHGTPLNSWNGHAGSPGSDTPLYTGSSNTLTYGMNNASGGSHGHAFTGTAINLEVKYLDMLMAVKD